MNRHGVWFEAPCRVAHDSDDVTVLWWPAGTIVRMPVFGARRDHLRLLAEGGWTMDEKTWWGGPAIYVVPRDAPFALWPYRLEAGAAPIAWYCKLQAPMKRTADAFETNDWTLDVVAAPDLSSWEWKDEDELEEGRRVGLYTDDDVARIRAAGDEVIALIESRAPIFEAWRDWLPEE